MQYLSQAVIMGELVSAQLTPFTGKNGKEGSVLEIVVEVVRLSGESRFVEHVPVTVFNRPDLKPAKGQQVVASGRIQNDHYDWTDPQTGEVVPRSRMRFIGLSVVLSGGAAVEASAPTKAAKPARTAKAVQLV